MEDTHTNKKTDLVQDLVVRYILEKAKKKEDGRLTQLSQKDSSASTELFRQEINRLLLGVKIIF